MGSKITAIFEYEDIVKQLGKNEVTFKLFNEITISEGKITLKSSQTPWVNNSDERPTYRNLYNQKIITRGYREFNDFKYCIDCSVERSHESQIFSPEDQLVFNLNKGTQMGVATFKISLGDAAARTGLAMDMLIPIADIIISKYLLVIDETLVLDE